MYIVTSYEVELDGSFSCTSPEQLSHIVNAHFFITIVYFAFHLGGFHSWCCTIYGKSYGIKNGRFS